IFRFMAPAAAPPGEPVMWVVPGGFIEPKPDLERKTRERFGQSFAMPLVPSPPTGTQALVKSNHDVDGLHRGHIRLAKTPVTFYREPDLSVYQPRFEQSARIAIRNTGAEAGRTALVFCIDLSGSMKYGPNGLPKDDNGKDWDPAQWRWRRVR